MAPQLLVFLLFYSPALHAKSSSAQRFVLLPVTGVNVSTAQRARLGEQLSRELRSRKHVQLIRPSSRAEACDETCWGQLGRQHAAQWVVGLDVGGLGGTFVLRLTVYDVARGAKKGSWQEVLDTLDEPKAGAALARMVGGFVPRPITVSRAPWYERWWVWSSLGAIVVAGVVTSVVLASRTDKGPDFTIIPIGP